MNLTNNLNRTQIALVASPVIPILIWVIWGLKYNISFFETVLMFIYGVAIALSSTTFLNFNKYKIIFICLFIGLISSIFYTLMEPIFFTLLYGILGMVLSLFNGRYILVLYVPILLAFLLIIFTNLLGNDPASAGYMTYGFLSLMATTYLPIALIVSVNRIKNF